MSNAARKTRRQSMAEKSEKRQAERNAAQKEQAAANKILRQNGLPTPWAQAKSKRSAARAKTRIASK